MKSEKNSAQSNTKNFWMESPSLSLQKRSVFTYAIRTFHVLSISIFVYANLLTWIQGWSSPRCHSFIVNARRMLPSLRLIYWEIKEDTPLLATHLLRLQGGCSPYCNSFNLNARWMLPSLRHIYCECKEDAPLIATLLMWFQGRWSPYCNSFNVNSR